MPSNKKLTDLIDYTNILPYASELFGIYQPLIGWKSKRTLKRFERGFLRDKRSLLDRLRSQFAAQVDVRYLKDCGIEIRMKPGALERGRIKKFDSILLQKVAEKLPPYEEYDAAIWSSTINPEGVRAILNDVVTPAYEALYTERCKDESSPRTDNTGMLATAGRRAPAARQKSFKRAFQSQLDFESSMAGAILFLAEHELHAELVKLFYSTKKASLQALELVKILAAMEAQDAYLNLDNLDPQDKNDIKNVALSPISVVHLFRQYFFELDSFVGTPVSHVWLSPGSNVELIEVHTLKTIEEKYSEVSTETISKTESSVTSQDEISEAVKEDNKQDIKFGASVSASYMSITATSNFDYGTSQQTAREQTHKQMREQTEKLSTEIRNNFKSTFKTVTETTDMTSKRYLLTNHTDQLINYELRRKMRQVAVQIQDVGTYLCWQTFVDRPGRELGVAELVHIGKPPELDGLHAPDEIPMLEPFTEDRIVTLPFVSMYDTDADNEDEVYAHGIEVDDSEVAGNLEIIQADFPIEVVCSKGSYELANVEFDGQGRPVSASRKGEITNDDNRSTFTLHLDSVDFQGQNSVQVRLVLHWTPVEGANDEAIAKNKENTEAFKAKEAAEYQKAFLETAKERIKLSHGIKARASEELREEERIVVYRKLIQDMLTNGVSMPDDHTRHVVAELINAIFDVDKMLYFVAPEWWRPQVKSHSQQLGSAAAPSDDAPNPDSTITEKMEGETTTITSGKLSAEKVGWGGTNDPNRDNYLITEDSDPAKFGSSLGWLLQLDGDNMRNAFLNSPWVKAVIPIRPTKERAAINWLKGVEGFNGISDSDIYRTNNPNEKDINGLPLDGQKMIDVIMDLAKKIEKKYREGLLTGQYPTQDELGNPPLVDEGNVVTATPIDRVYEHGFYPLEGGFRANVGANYEIFDQWIEILPTDQIVPVEVKYDSKTGRQI
jgi:hypothetical protein